MSKKGIISGEVDVMHGSMVINEGQIESVSGSLVGQDHLAQIFQRLLQSGCGEEVLTTGERFKTVTIAFPQHYYTISRKGPKIFVARMAHNSASAEMFVNGQSNTVSEDSQNVQNEEGEVGKSVAQIDDRKTSSNFVEERAAESDNESTTTSSSIATVKSDQEKDSDDEDNEPVEKEGPSNIHLPTTINQESHSIESSIQQLPAKKN